MNFWVCFERNREDTPWVVRKYRQSTPDTRRKGFWKQADAQRRVDRLKSLWGRWFYSNVVRRIPLEGVTEEGLETLAVQVFNEMHIDYLLVDIRRAARKVGLKPDDVIRYETKFGEPRRVFPGPFLQQLTNEQLEISRKPLAVEVGQSWSTLDPRRTTIMKVVKIDGDYAMDASGRRVHVRRLLTRYCLMK